MAESFPDPDSGITPVFEVVVAHYNEDLSWLKPLALDTIVYTKGASINSVLENCRMIYKLDNIGRESHTYLHHLYTNYHILADVTIFVQGDVYNNDGSAPPHTTMGTYAMKDRALDLAPGEVLPLGDRRRRFVDWNGIPWETCPAHAEWYATHKSDQMLRAERTPGELWTHATREAHPHAVYWSEGACFAVRCEDVWKRRRSFYKRLLDMFTADSQEIGHFMERFWFAIFSDKYRERDASEQREEDRGVLACKLEGCNAHGTS